LTLKTETDCRVYALTEHSLLENVTVIRFADTLYWYTVQHADVCGGGRTASQQFVRRKATASGGGV